jgi:hypothetical protein
MVEGIKLNSFAEELDRLLIVTSREGGIALGLQQHSSMLQGLPDTADW